MDVSKSEKLAHHLWESVGYGHVNEVKSLLKQGANPNHPLFWNDKWLVDHSRLPPLHTACVQAKLAIAKSLIHSGADVNIGDKRFNMSPLHYACFRGNKDIVMYLIKDTKCRLDVMDNNHQTVLHHACKGGNIEVIQYLVLQLKSDIDIRDIEGRTPLDLVVNNQYFFEIARCLLSHGFCDSEDKVKVLCESCRKGKLDMVKELVMQSTVHPIDIKDDNGHSLLEIALMSDKFHHIKDCIDVAIYLVNTGCGNEQDISDLFCRACQTKRRDVLAQLVAEHKIDPNKIMDDYSRTPLHHACYWGNKEAVEYLVEVLNCDIYVISMDGQSPLKMALGDVQDAGHFSVAQYLIKRGSGNYDDKVKLLYGACWRGDLNVVKELIKQHKVDPRGLSNEKQQPLLDTTLERIKDEHYCIDVVIYLMNCGCTCSYTDMINLLFGVCAHGKLNVVKDLVEHHKVNPQGLKNDNRKSLLDIALDNVYKSDDCVDISLYLLHQGCGDRDEIIEVFCEACRCGKLKVVNELIDNYQVDPNNVKDDKQQLPLEIALQYMSEKKSCVDTAHYLVNCGCGSNEDKSKLMFGACQWGLLELVKDLARNHNINPQDIRDMENKTPLHHASIRGQGTVVQYLVEEFKCKIESARSFQGHSVARSYLYIQTTPN